MTYFLLISWAKWMQKWILGMGSRIIRFSSKYHQSIKATPFYSTPKAARRRSNWLRFCSWKRSLPICTYHSLPGAQLGRWFSRSQMEFWVSFRKQLKENTETSPSAIVFRTIFIFIDKLVRAEMRFFCRSLEGHLYLLLSGFGELQGQETSELLEP